MWGVKSNNPAVKGRATTVRGGGREAAATNAAAMEVRPGGMLVQKRSSDVNQSQNQVSNIKVKVKYGSSYHEVNVNSQASFGELKKKLQGATGLNHLDQKLTFKDKERESKAYLDVAGVKDGSKMVLFDDVITREKRLLQSLKTAHLDKARNQIDDITFEVDNLIKQVEKLEIEISGGKKVVEKVLLNLIELFMSQLIKLDGIVADGEVKSQRRKQVKRVQRYIETLDMLKIHNSLIKSKNASDDDVPVQLHLYQNNISFERKLVTPMEKQHDRSMQRAIVTMTEWEKF